MDKELIAFFRHYGKDFLPGLRLQMKQQHCQQLTVCGEKKDEKLRQSIKMHAVLSREQMRDLQSVHFRDYAETCMWKKLGNCPKSGRNLHFLKKTD